MILRRNSGPVLGVLSVLATDFPAVELKTEGQAMHKKQKLKELLERLVVKS